MNRYSDLYGTVYADKTSKVAVYSSIGAANKPLLEFLDKMGGINSANTIDTVRKIMSGFPEIKEYREAYWAQPQNDPPVSVRYAPMHLRNLSYMPDNMKPFTALTITGNENKKSDEGDTRASYYVQTTYIAREHMHETVTETVQGIKKTYNYLDQIFGTEWLNYRKVAMLRNGKQKMEQNERPAKVDPVMQQHDRNVVYNTIDAVFEDKTVVIRLERNCGFNARAKELLIPIYALMPPRLATEIGFVTYIEPERIGQLSKDTSIRIFVVPAECDLSKLGNINATIIDLTADEIASTAAPNMRNVLNGWMGLPWEKRQVAMEKVFADTAANFNDKALFLQRSRDYFMDAFFEWEKSDADRGTIGTLEELKAKFDSFPLCAEIPWVKEQFIKRIPMLLKKGLTLPQMTADVLALAIYSKDEEEKKQAQQLYRFASELMSVDNIPYARSAGKLVRTLTQEEDRIELNKAVAAGQAALAQTKAEANAAIAAEQKNTADAVAAGQAALAQAKAEAEAAIAAEQKNTADAVAAGQTALAQAKAEAEAAIAAEQKNTADAVAAGQAALAQAKTEAEAAIAAEQQKTEQVKLVAAEKIKSEREAHQATQQKLDAEVQTHQATQQKLDQETQTHRDTQQKLDTAQQERDGLNQRLERAKEEYTKLKQAKAISDSKIAAAEKAKEEADQLIAKHERLCDEVDARKEKYDEMIKKTNQRLIIFAAAGFLAASLIFGVILLIIGLTGDKEPPQVTEPTATVEVTEPTEPSTEATELATEPSTEPETEPTEPDLTNWADNIAAQWILENVPGIQEIQQTDLDQIPDEVKKIQDYSAVAVIRMETEQEETADQQFAVLLQRNLEATTDMAPMDSNLAEPGKEELSDEQKAAQEESSEPTDPTETEETVAVEETEPPTEEQEEEPLTAVEVAGAKVVLTSDDFVMVVYGDDQSMATALQVYAQIVNEEQEVLTRWNAGERSLDLDGMFSQILMDNRWWATANQVSLDAAAVQEEVAVYAVDESALLRITCGGSKVYVVECMNEFLADSLCEKLTQAGQIADYSGSLVAFKAVTE